MKVDIMNYNDMLERLKMLDEEAYLRFGNDNKYQLFIAGGSGLAMLRVIPRATHDIDAIYASPELVGLIEKYDINCRVQTFEELFPYNYQTRLKRLDIPTRVIEYYVVSLEDTVIAKLFAGRRQDIMDITSPELISSLDWEKLIRISGDREELMKNWPNEYRYNTFLYHLEKYIEEYRK